jgi:hypothetical protein
VTVAKIEERGWQADACMIVPDETADPMLGTQLLRARYDCVVIGGGLRLRPKGLGLFQLVVNVGGRRRSRGSSTQAG